MKYQNPILFADYSDPDVIRVGDTYYMTASSFQYTPGLPILISRNLIDWRLVNYAVKRLGEGFERPRHSEGIWAPALRYHNEWYYIYYGMPDEGIFVVCTRDPLGDWEEPVCIMPGKGLIDPCPFWDDDGKCYLIHGYAKSRIGFKSILGIFELSADGLRATGEDRFLFNGNLAAPAAADAKEASAAEAALPHTAGVFRERSDTGYGAAQAEFTPDEDRHPAITIEGPKVYKRNGRYYILAPAGGVVHGWQVCLRSDSIYGPYEGSVVLHRGSSPVNGPHQGALIETAEGEAYFLHFQDRGLYGRICHLQPFQWTDDGFCVIGSDPDGSGCGEPVEGGIVPDGSGCGETVESGLALNGLHNIYYVNPESMSDSFENGHPGLLWQWMGDAREEFLAGEEICGEAPEAPKHSGEENHREMQEATQCFSVENDREIKTGYRKSGLCLRALNRTGAKNPLIWNSPNVLTMKLTQPEFQTDVALDASELCPGDRAGIVMMGGQYFFLEVRCESDHNLTLYYGFSEGPDRDKREKEFCVTKEQLCEDAANAGCPVRLQKEQKIKLRFIFNGAGARYAAVDSPHPKLRCAYAEADADVTEIEASYQPSDHTWVGAKLGLYAISTRETGGYARFLRVVTVP